MLKTLTKNMDSFSRNIILVFLGSFLVNFLNFLYQLIIAHRLNPADFAAFNSLLSIVMLIATPLSALQIVIAKYSAEFNAKGKDKSVCFLLSMILKWSVIVSLFTLGAFYFGSSHILKSLKIASISSGHITAVLLALLAWIWPVFMGGLQGLERFSWLTAVLVVGGILKVILAYIFLGFSFGITGALGAFVVSDLVGLAIAYFPLRSFLSFRCAIDDVKEERVDFKEFFAYLFPVAASSFCFISLVSFDMVMVKYFFSPEDSGIYSLAQMLGKVFLFLPLAISAVMFPRTSGLDAKNLDTLSTLRRSLLYTAVLCLLAMLVYNIFPSFVLMVLTGKPLSETIILGRFFSVSMSFFTMAYILMTYFLSKKDTRFLKYMFLSALLQIAAVLFFHRTLIQVQLILCINAILLFFAHLVLAFKNKGFSPA